MNIVRRRNLEKISKQLSELSEKLYDLQAEEQDSVDNFPENLQGTDKYSDMEAAAESLQEACDGIDLVISHIEEACG